MALTQSDKQSIADLVRELLLGMGVCKTSDLGKIHVRLEDLERGMHAALSDSVKSYKPGASVEDIKAVLDQNLKQIPQAVVEHLRAESPKMFDEDFTSRPQSDPGEESAHWWMALADKVIDLPLTGIVKMSKGMTFSERNHPIKALQAAGGQFRRMYLSEVARHGLTE